MRGMLPQAIARTWLWLPLLLHLLCGFFRLQHEWQFILEPDWSPPGKGQPLAGILTQGPKKKLDKQWTGSYNVLLTMHISLKLMGIKP